MSIDQDVHRKSAVNYRKVHTAVLAKTPPFLQLQPRYDLYILYVYIIFTYIIFIYTYCDPELNG